MESFGSKHNLDTASEQELFNVEKGIERERTILGRFREKTKNIARVMLFVSALSAGSVVAKEAQAIEINQTSEVELKKPLESNQGITEQEKRVSELFLEIQKRDEAVGDRVDKLRDRFSKMVAYIPRDQEGFEVQVAHAMLRSAWKELEEISKHHREIVSAWYSREFRDQYPTAWLLVSPRQVLDEIKMANEMLDRFEEKLNNLKP